MPNWLVQTILLTTSVFSQYFYAFVEANKRRPAYIISLCAQPVWFYAMLKTGNWGVALLSFWFAYNSIRGIRNHYPSNNVVVKRYYRPEIERDSYVAEMKE
jgi:hypothetical protein